MLFFIVCLGPSQTFFMPLLAHLKVIHLQKIGHLNGKMRSVLDFEINDLL